MFDKVATIPLGLEPVMVQPPAAAPSLSGAERHRVLARSLKARQDLNGGRTASRDPREPFETTDTKDGYGYPTRDKRDLAGGAGRGGYGPLVSPQRGRFGLAGVRTETLPIHEAQRAADATERAYEDRLRAYAMPGQDVVAAIRYAAQDSTPRGVGDLFAVLRSGVFLIHLAVLTGARVGDSLSGTVWRRLRCSELWRGREARGEAPATRRAVNGRMRLAGWWIGGGLVYRTEAEARAALTLDRVCAVWDLDPALDLGVTR